MPFGGLQDELEEVLGHKVMPYWKAYYTGDEFFKVDFPAGPAAGRSEPEWTRTATSRA